MKVISGGSKGKEGKVIFVDRKKDRVLVEGANMVKKHVKPGAVSYTHLTLPTSDLE